MINRIFMPVVMQVVFCILFFNTSISQQQKIEIQFLPQIADCNLLMNDSCVVKSDSIQIKMLKFYISSIQFLKQGKVVLKDPTFAHLLNIEDSNSFQFSVEKPQNLSFDHVQFSLGIDSLTNVSGVMSGDLDPTKGMYWTWQSGYINFKLEGERILPNGENEEFTYHLGGYQNPFACFNTQILEVSDKNRTIILELDLQPMLNEAEVRNLQMIMSPKKESVELSKIVINSFKVIVQ